MKKLLHVALMASAIILPVGLIGVGCAESVDADTTVVDTGSTGEGGSDSTTPDSAKDTGSKDTGTPDTGTPDTGDPDTGDPDTGDFPDFGTDSGSSTGDGGSGAEIGPFAPGIATCSKDTDCGEGACCTKANTCGVLFAGDCVAF